MALDGDPTLQRDPSFAYGIRWATNAADIADFWRVVGRCFAGDQYRGFTLPQTFIASAEILLNQATIVVLTISGRAAAVGMSVWSGSAAGLYWIATLPEFRRRGAASVVTAALVGRLRDEGAERCYLQASQAGMSIYRRLGFRSVLWRTVHIADPAGSPSAGAAG